MTHLRARPGGPGVGLRLKGWGVACTGLHTPGTPGEGSPAGGPQGRPSEGLPGEVLRARYTVAGASGRSVYKQGRITEVSGTSVTVYKLGDKWLFLGIYRVVGSRSGQGLVQP